MKRSPDLLNAQLVNGRMCALNTCSAARGGSHVTLPAISCSDLWLASESPAPLGFSMFNLSFNEKMEANEAFHQSRVRDAPLGAVLARGAGP